MFSLISIHRLMGVGKITIGGDVMITIVNHNFSNRKELIRKAKSQPHEVVIEQDVWIGGHCSIIPASKICIGSVIAAGAVFTKTGICEDYAIYAGVLAKQIRRRS